MVILKLLLVFIISSHTANGLKCHQQEFKKGNEIKLDEPKDCPTKAEFCRMTYSKGEEIEVKYECDYDGKCTGPCKGKTENVVVLESITCCCKRGPCDTKPLPDEKKTVTTPKDTYRTTIHSDATATATSSDEETKIVTTPKVTYRTTIPTDATTRAAASDEETTTVTMPKPKDAKTIPTDATTRAAASDKERTTVTMPIPKDATTILTDATTEAPTTEKSAVLPALTITVVVLAMKMLSEVHFSFS